MNKTLVVHTMRAADAQIVAAGCRFDRRCSRCNHLCCTSVSTEAEILRRADQVVVIVCTHCRTADDCKGEDVSPSIEAILSEAMTAGPNPWRRRN